MRDTLTEQQRRLPTIGLALLILVLWGCAEAPRQEAPEKKPPPVEAQSAASQEISLALPPSEFSAQFSSAEQSLAQFDWMTASATLEPLPSEQLTINDNAYLVYLQARIDYARGEQTDALSKLAQLGDPGINPALQYRILNFKRHILEMSGDSLQSAQLGDQILRWAPAADAPALKRGIWRNLQRLDASRLQAALTTATDPQWEGWLELALMSRDTPSTAAINLSVWRTTHAGHPAAQPLPGGLDYLVESAPQLDKVALLLPLSGRLALAGKAVRDGYLAGYYAGRAAGDRDYELLVFDTDSYDSASTAYEQALSAGANLVVGPLSREAVAELGTLAHRPVPILTLNRIEQVLPATGSPLVQLSLAPEDESVRIAELAFGKGARSALIVRPAGPWGDKVEQSLQQRWSALGGRVANRVTYDKREDYSANVKSALDLNASDKRAREIRDMLATNIEATPRRRQDVDVVFLLSRSGAEARSIKPLLAFHYAGNLPVYAISSIYSGIPDARDRDLNGINMVEIPWLLGANPGLRVAIAAGDTGSDNYTRLNALGADAFLLQSSFSQLQAGPDALLRGNTGLLSMDPQQRIERELPLATFDGGALKAQ
jgi:outer membrane PBP1 activator LpoA protein